MADILELGDFRGGDSLSGLFRTSLPTRGRIGGQSYHWLYANHLLFYNGRPFPQRQLLNDTPGGDAIYLEPINVSGDNVEFSVLGTVRAATITETRVARFAVGQYYQQIIGSIVQWRPTGTTYVLEVHYRVIQSATHVPTDPPPTTGPGTGSGDDQTNPDPPVTPDAPSLLTWFQARVEAVGGSRIRLVDWTDRWLEFDGALWHMQVYNPLTGAAGTRRVVQAIDFGAEEFRSLRWTLTDIPGQPVTAGTLWRQADPQLRYP